MARKTALNKEPGNVSVALPQSEKDRLAGRKPQLTRLSPGIYRDASGRLVGSRGQELGGRFRGPTGQQIGRQLGQVQLRPNGNEVGNTLGQWPNWANNPAGIDPGYNIGAQDPGFVADLENQARQRAEAIRRGEPVTQDYNPERERRVQQILNELQNEPPQASQQPNDQQMPQMPQPSRNYGGRYRLSPGVYGSREQAMRQYEEQKRQFEMMRNGQPPAPIAPPPGQSSYNPSKWDWTPSPSRMIRKPW